MNSNDNFENRLSKVWTRKVNSYHDDRGYFLEYFRRNQCRDFDVDFVQDSVSFSQKNVLRGLHIQENQWQLSTLLRGSVRYFVLDVDPSSKDYLKLETIALSTDGTSQVLAAPGIAHGFFAESSDVVMSYKNSTYYDNSLQHGINFSSFRELESELNDCVRSKRDIEFIEMTEILNDNFFKEFQSRISLER
jgi:dTDP-4-dehydrorhamnose 3,5-epimerase